MRRAISTRHLREVSLVYSLNQAELNTLMHYMINDLDDGKDVIDGWTMPETSSSGHDTNASRLVNVTNGGLTFSFPQTYKAGDWLYIDMPGVVGAFRIATVVSNQAYILEDTGTNSTGQGRARIHFPKAAVILSDSRIPAPQKVQGPNRDDKGHFELVVNLQERL